MILDGQKILNETKNKIKLEINKYNFKINLAVIFINNNPASEIYINHKKKACEYVGINIFIYDLDKNISQDHLLKLIYSLNNNKYITWIFLQLPIPDHINQNIIFKNIDPLKDIDGLNPINIANLILNKKNIFSRTLVPCTALGIIKLLEYYNIKIQKQNCVIIGRSILVGKPLALLLLNLNATITICHSYTKNLKSITKTADILISAVGKANFIKSDFIKPNSTLIDVGINKINKNNKNKICGDIDFNNCFVKAKNITPVPGGVGPMTIAMLLNNCLLAYKLLNNINLY